MRVSAPAARNVGTDEAVLAESLACPELFGELYARHFADIYRYMAARLGPDVADDLAAETFLAAFRRKHTFDPRLGAVRPWLYGIATNLIAGHRRAESRRYAALARIGIDAAVQDDEEQIAQRLTAWQARRSLARALARLPDRDRDVLLLTYAAGSAGPVITGTQLTIDPHAKIWSIQQGTTIRPQLPQATSAALLRQYIAAHVWTVIGRSSLAGQPAIELGTAGPNGLRELLWVNARTHLPMRQLKENWNGPGSTLQYDIEYLPATPANLAKLTPAIPPGYKRVPPL